MKGSHLKLETPFTRHAGVKIPIIGGAMYPCSNLELVAAVSQAGGLGVIQPISIIYAHRQDLRTGIRKIRQITPNPLGFNLLVEKSAKTYEDRMRQWLDIAVEEGVRFFITALGNPRWVVDRVRPVGGIVYHDVTSRKWADKALDADVDGFICVNNRAGGHAGTETPDAIYKSLVGLGKPLVCAGGVGSEEEFLRALQLGYAGVQMGTRFIATEECSVHSDYKSAIVKAKDSDIVLTDKISGVPVAVIRTPYIDKIGTKAGPLARFLLRGHKTKHYMRMFYTLKSAWQLRKASIQGGSYRDYFQAGKSVAGVKAVEPVRNIIARFAEYAERA